MEFDTNYTYKRIFPKISAYTTCYNAINMGYPFIESISSMLGFCDELIIVDHSTDETSDILKKMATDDARIQVIQREWDLNNPSQDGDAKAFARAMCSHEFCWQQDLDEVVHEKDYERIKWLTRRFPTQAHILHLPVIELWGDQRDGHQYVTGRRHSWKWRLSRNRPEITHGINIHARLTDEKTGNIYAREGMSDGCEYIDIATFEMLPHAGFYTSNLEQVRTTYPEQYGIIMNKLFEQVPSVYHYSWWDLHGKIKQFETNWDRQWSVLYQKQLPPRFPDADKNELVNRLYDAGGEDNDTIKYKFKLEHSHPAIMEDWLNEHSHKQQVA